LSNHNPSPQTLYRYFHHSSWRRPERDCRHRGARKPCCFVVLQWLTDGLLDWEKFTDQDSRQIDPVQHPSTTIMYTRMLEFSLTARVVNVPLARVWFIYSLVQAMAAKALCCQPWHVNNHRPDLRQSIFRTYCRCPLLPILILDRKLL
jgi:hypothetical protein